MPPRMPSSAEVKIAVSTIEPAREAIRRDTYEKLHKAAAQASFSTERGKPLDEGGYLQLRQTVPKVYKQHAIDNEMYTIAYSRQKESVRAKGERRTPTIDEWAAEPVQLTLHLEHEETRAVSDFPIAQIAPDAVMLAETAEDGRTLWREIDLMDVSNAEEVAMIQETVDFLNLKSE